MLRSSPGGVVHHRDKKVVGVFVRFFVRRFMRMTVVVKTNVGTLLSME
jgi:hypothetical protein